jgi:hypothetical protein
MKKLLLIFLLPAIIAGGIGKVSAVKGKAEAFRKGVTVSISLQLGSVIERGDRIKTSSDSKVQIILNDETTVTIGANSEYSFDDYLYDGTSSSRAKMSAKHGFFRVVSGKIKKVARKRFTVKTKSAVIGIRGTVFDGFVKNGYEKIRCWSGAVYLQTSSGLLNLASGKMALFRNGKWIILDISSSMSSMHSSQTKYSMTDKQRQQLDQTRESLMRNEVDLPSVHSNLENSNSKSCCRR